MGGWEILKIRTKLTLEVILLVSLVGTVSLTAVLNTEEVQNKFLELTTGTMPVLDSLKDMRYSSTKISATTMEMILLHDESSFSKALSIEEKLEAKFYDIEKAKELFNVSFSQYFSLLESNYPNQVSNAELIAERWNDMLIASNNLISAKNSGVSGGDILVLAERFENNQRLIEETIENAIVIASSEISTKQGAVDSIVGNTTLTALIILNLFIAIALGTRLLIVKSISKPLQKLQNTTKEIALGNFVKSDLIGDDEISDLGRHIDKMSGDLEKLNENIVKSERLSSIGQLASRLAHDLRNPLSIIKNSLAILNVKFDSIMDEKTSLQMARVGKAVDRMVHQIEDVLDYVNVSELKLEPTSLVSVIESSLLGVDIPQQIKVVLPKNNITINCDPYKLESAFCNLITNSVQAIDGDGEIKINIKDSHKDVIIDFIDSGSGIEENLMLKIFEPLFTTKQVGTGLGLPGCKSVIEKHGGTISISNNPTKFSITLPKEPIENSEKPKIPGIVELEKSLHD